MKKVLFILAAPFLLLACNEKTPDKQEYAVLPLTDAGLIKQGEHLVAIAGCNDCHTPKKMSESGPVPDPDLLLSGHPEKMPLAPYDSVTAKNWLLFNMNLSAFVGPWGTSFAGNLTPDVSGLGNWSEEQFSNAIRKGFFKGMTNGRRILPPMPWESFANFSDDEVHAIFAYLKSIKPVKNYVPTTIPPPGT